MPLKLKAPCRTFEMRARDRSGGSEKIDTLNEQLSDPETASDYEKMMEITNKITEQKALADSLMNDWTELTLWLEKRRVTKGN